MEYVFYNFKGERCMMEKKYSFKMLVLNGYRHRLVCE